jgi:hypothetical protein
MIDLVGRRDLTAAPLDRQHFGKRFDADFSQVEGWARCRSARFAGDGCCAPVLYVAAGQLPGDRRRRRCQTGVRFAVVGRGGRWLQPVTAGGCGEELE